MSAQLTAVRRRRGQHRRRARHGDRRPLGGGERSAQTYMDYRSVPPAFPAHAHYVALGHVHRTQQIGGAAPIWYSGSPIQVDFGEVEPSNVSLVRRPRSPAGVRPRGAGGRRLRTLRGSWNSCASSPADADDASCASWSKVRSRPASPEDVRELLGARVVEVRLGSTRGCGSRRGAARIGQTPHELFAVVPRERACRGSTRLTAVLRRAARRGHRRCGRSRSSPRGSPPSATRSTVDFTGVDFFAFVGPTGSGKSSVLDAMCFALYGTVPRLDDDRLVAPSITQGGNEARVSLRFELGGDGVRRDRGSCVARRRVARRRRRRVSSATARCSPAMRRDEHDGRRAHRSAVQPLHAVRDPAAGRVRSVPARQAV